MKQSPSTHYSINWRRAVHRSWTNELSQAHFNVTGTLKFVHAQSISSEAAHKTIKAYWHKLDRTFFGHAADKGMSIERWVFTELGKAGDNAHCHFKAHSPIDPFLFCCIANAMWANFNRHTAQGKKSWITPTQLNTQSAQYTTKGTRDFQFDPTGLASSRTNRHTVNYQSFENSAQAQRILNKVSVEQLEQARQAVEWQIAKTQRLILIRQRRAEVRGIRQAI